MTKIKLTHKREGVSVLDSMPVFTFQQKTYYISIIQELGGYPHNRNKLERRLVFGNEDNSGAYVNNNAEPVDSVDWEAGFLELYSLVMKAMKELRAIGINTTIEMTGGGKHITIINLGFWDLNQQELVDGVFTKKLTNDKK